LTEDFHIRSNRETGLGRADIVLTPFDQTQIGFVIELKFLPAGKALDAALEQALEQIETKRYRARTQPEWRRVYYEPGNRAARQSGQDQDPGLYFPIVTIVLR